MIGLSKEILERLMNTFRLEAREHLQALTSGLLELEQEAVDAKRNKILEVIYREAHSFKGAARAVNMTTIEGICQALESAFAAFQKKAVNPDEDMFDLLQKMVDGVGALLNTPDPASNSIAAQELIRLKANLLKQLETGPETVPVPAEPETNRDAFQVTKPEPAPEVDPVRTTVSKLSRPAPEQEPVTAESETQTVRIATSRLDPLLFQMEEMLQARLALKEQLDEIRSLSHDMLRWDRDWTEKIVDFKGLRSIIDGAPTGDHERASFLLGRLLDFVDHNQLTVRELRQRISKTTSNSEQYYHQISRMVDSLLEDMKNILMYPFTLLLEILPKVVRDLSRELGREVDLNIEGSDIEIDRRILEGLKDPLIHLIRNSIDHGIETPAERRAKNKPQRGRISIKITQAENKFIKITIGDDGRGIQFEKIMKSAISQNLMTEVEAREMPQHEVLNLVYRSGVSSCSMITSISGRGLGMAIVQEKVKKIGGTVAIVTEPGQGTSITLTIPIILATYRGVLVESRREQYIIPTASVERIIHVPTAELRTVENRAAVTVNEETVPVVSLGDVLEQHHSDREKPVDDILSILILRTETSRIGLLIDAALGEQEILVKVFKPPIKRIRNLSGTTILGTGKVVPVLSVEDLEKSCARLSGQRVQTAAESAEEGTGAHTILVVEDSITSRMLLRNILESAGYRVLTAVDGMDGFATLKTEAIDLVVSDVDMPRLNGFGLTIKIRETREYADLPVILVTALESREDRERGIDAGANAYLVKRSFDQSNLLEAVERLL